MKIKIADICVELNLKKIDVILPMYQEFIVNNGEEYPDIVVDIKDIGEMKKASFSDEFDHDTYIWKKVNNNYILIFPSRGVFLDECQKQEIWYLVGNNELTNCILYIPNLYNLEKDYLICELERRPWLQRLFINYCMNKNIVVMHGALCNIENQGCLFLGNSGAGKSTICSIIEKNYSVYSDDRFVLRIYHDRIIGYGTPWNIKNPKYCHSNFIEVKKAYFLSHGKNEIEKLENKLEAVKRLMAQILHASIYKPEDILCWKIKVSNSIFSSIKLFDYSFFPDESCLNFIKGEFDEY